MASQTEAPMIDQRRAPLPKIIRPLIANGSLDSATITGLFKLSRLATALQSEATRQTSAPKSGHTTGLAASRRCSSELLNGSANTAP